MVSPASVPAEHCLRALFATAPDALLVEQDGAIAEANDAACTLFGLRRAELVGARAADLLRPLGRPGRSGDGAEIASSKYTRDDGTTLFLELCRWGATLGGERVTFLRVRDLTGRRRLEEALRARHAELEQANRKLVELATIDALTTLYNRRALDAELGLAWRRALRSGKSLAILLADIDGFKAYNDGFGHIAGDECLRRVASAIRRGARRRSDFVARYGGEEFALLLPDADLDGARDVAEAVRAAIEELQIPAVASPWVTVSIGVAQTIPTIGARSETLVDAADRALYAAKARGRNRVEVA